MLKILRSGAWATPERLSLYVKLLFALGMVLIFVSLVGPYIGLGVEGRQAGTDFAQVWVAGQAALAGDVFSPYVPTTHFAHQRAVFGANADIYGWHYPPYFLAVAAALALIPYFAALMVWEILGLLAYLATMRLSAIYSGFKGKAYLIAAIAFPAALSNIVHGQNAFVTTALFTSGLILTQSRPILAGVLLSGLAYKPQFAALVPLILAAAGAWRAMASAAAAFIVATLGVTILFGPQVWGAFYTSLEFTQRVVIEQGATGFEKIQSIFAAVRLLGGAIPLAYFFQGCVSAFVIVTIMALWRFGGDRRLAIAASLTGALLTTPYCLDYDMVVLAPALLMACAYAQQNGFRDWEKTFLALVFIMPMSARAVGFFLGVPLGALITCIFYVYLIAQAAPAVKANIRHAIARVSSRRDAANPNL